MIIVTIISFVLISVYPKENEVETLSKYGSRGSEVTQIQTKLKRWGYYKGNIDGIFGTQTLEAVKYFQRKNGLVVDGIAGKKHWKQWEFLIHHHHLVLLAPILVI